MAPDSGEPAPESVIRVQSPDMRTFIHSLVLSDRAIHEAQVRAFVSYIKSYSERQLKYIFPLNNLPFARVLDGYFMLCAPKCPELATWNARRQKSADTSPVDGYVFRERIAVADLARIAYADKSREAMRQERAKAGPKKPPPPRRSSSAA